MINSLENFPSLPQLETLSINNNNLMNVNILIKNINSKFPKIKSLNTLRNPMNPGLNDIIEYKKFKTFLTQITYLEMVDGMKINEEIMNKESGKRDLFGNLSTTNVQTTQKRDLFGNNTISNNQENKINNNNINNINNNNNLNYENENYNKNLNSNNNSIKMINFQKKSNNSSEPQMDGTSYVKSLKKHSCIMYNEKIFKKSDNLTKFNRKNHSEGNKHILNIML